MDIEINEPRCYFCGAALEIVQPQIEEGDVIIAGLARCPLCEDTYVFEEDEEEGFWGILQ